MITVYESHEDIGKKPPRGGDVFVYRDAQETQIGGLKWCVAAARHSGGQVQVRDLGAFYSRDDAIVFAAVYANPKLIRTILKTSTVH